MAQPVVVSSYASRQPPKGKAPGSRAVVRAHALPPVSSYAFTDILRAADSEELQTAIEGIAEIYAKSRLSLADEYGAHMPPIGELTAASSAKARPHLLRPMFHRALTSVPEGSSGSSEGSRKSQRKTTQGSIFSFKRQQMQESKPGRRIRVGSMGRVVTAQTTTALTVDAWTGLEHSDRTSNDLVVTVTVSQHRSNAGSFDVPNNAHMSLQNILLARSGLPDS